MIDSLDNQSSYMKPSRAQSSCILCGEQPEPWIIKRHQFSHCSHCGLVQRLPENRLSPIEEKARYEKHNNSLENKGYVSYLSKFINQFIRPSMKSIDDLILDYGSGPLPVLSLLLKNEGVQVKSYDPYFLPDASITGKSYDLIILHEVLEHIGQPLEVLKKLKALLSPKGSFLIQTEFLPKNQDLFNAWWYKEDMTHITFLGKETLFVLADSLKMKLVVLNEKNTFKLIHY